MSQNWLKSMAWACLTAATTSCREVPLIRSMASPRLTCSGSTRVGLPAISAYE